jgi:phosphatidylglycerophosphatase A
MTTSPRDDAAVRRLSLATLRDPVQLLALGFGAGLAPRAPGTFGSLVGLALAIVIARWGWTASVVATLAACIAGVWICGASARRLGVHDHPAIVWDEVAGMMITMLAAPPGWMWTLLAFVLFRALDIIKPWPIREIDHGMRGGAGIMLDDVLAGILAALGLMLVRSTT